MNPLILVAALCIGQTHEFDMGKLNRLVELRQAADAVHQLSDMGYNVNEDVVLEKIYDEARQIIDGPVTYDILKQYTGEAKSPLEKFTGFFTFVNILYVTGAALGVAARTNPNLEIIRNVVMVECFPPLTKIANRKQVILHGAEPIEEKQ